MLRSRTHSPENRRKPRLEPLNRPRSNNSRQPLERRSSRPQRPEPRSNNSRQPLGLHSKGQHNNNLLPGPYSSNSRQPRERPNSRPQRPEPRSNNSRPPHELPSNGKLRSRRKPPSNVKPRNRRRVPSNGKPRSRRGPRSSAKLRNREKEPRDRNSKPDKRRSNDVIRRRAHLPSKPFPLSSAIVLGSDRTQREHAKVCGEQIERKVGSVVWKSRHAD